ncbi:MAG: hypothetical protein MR894_05425, partial [Akkermansia muciniphila]|nr:hypothetical protein [Akkermansia muciniphila]
KNRENPISDEGHNQRAVPISEATGIHLQELSRSAGSRGVVIKTDGVPKKCRRMRLLGVFLSWFFFKILFPGMAAWESAKSAKESTNSRKIFRFYRQNLPPLTTRLLHGSPCFPKVFPIALSQNNHLADLKGNL